MTQDRSRRHRGTSQQQPWIEQAWFAPTAAYPVITDVLVSGEEVQALRGLFSDKVGYEPDRQALRRVYDQMMAGQREYLWAFGSLADVIRFTHLRHRAAFKPYPHPGTIGEYAVHALYQRFPFDASLALDVLVFHGEAAWRDPRSGPGPGAASLAVEVPRLVARRDRWRDASLGFEQGLSLVAVAHDQPFYRADEALFEQIWAEARRQQGLHTDAVWSEEQTRAVERAARRQLIQRLEARS